MGAGPLRWHLARRPTSRYGLSCHDVEELLAERGIAVDHVTVYRWVQRIVHHGGAGTTVAARACVPQIAMLSDRFYWASRIRNSASEHQW